ncbi:ORF6N domain-containing protein [Mucilaginibacter gossypiicola]|uniref:ORF6N domain-containing protein n=1 Tax=Mucilaginibacter gossypiicola TaxID=551995 RepID=A0A1H8B120_9SPHI|nr:ORF6N domain-containing protein [Mucilaginibacter gossypiicola]SEM76630.1 ORF6N domain-containing protein [Mucilaginibacter gossypiicola]
MKELKAGDQEIAEKIYLIRGHKIMLDKDLAEMYGVETKRLIEQVNRNTLRFPPEFMFRLTNEEFDVLRSQFATSKRGGRRYAPYVFTEHGILMLSSVLNSKQAITMSIKIIEVFVKFREMLISHKDLLLKFEQLEKLVIHHDDDIQSIFQALKQLIQQKNEPREPIGFKLNG